MSTDVLVATAGVSKKFARSLRRTVTYSATDILRNMVGLRAEREHLRPGEFWSLDDVSFELRRGETLGVVGSNGAGKSTLLKLIAGLILPDRGIVRVRGRVGALIEVGAGFHPLLSGRENIFVNAALLGMSRAEVRTKFDAIVEFAGIGNFLDSPLKFYSSGMHVRLGFAVAAHLDPDVLLVDEILAVGDAAFRRRCQEHMERLRRGGATILFVSHNSHHVQQLCDRALYLRAGKVAAIGAAGEVLFAYQRDTFGAGDGRNHERSGIDPGLLDGAPSTDEIEILALRTLDAEGAGRPAFATGDTLVVEVEYLATRRIEGAAFALAIHREDGVVCSMEKTTYQGVKVDTMTPGRARFTATLKSLPLRPARYFVEVAIHDAMQVVPYGRAAGAWFSVSSSLPYTEVGQLGVCELPVEWGVDV